MTDTREDEEAFLGAVLVDAEALNLPGFDREDFFNRPVYESLGVALRQKAAGTRPDLVTVGVELPEHASTLARITGVYASSANASFYLDRVIRAARNRSAERTAHELLEELVAGRDDAAIEQAARNLARLEEKVRGIASGFAALEIRSARDEQEADLPARTWYLEDVIPAGLAMLQARKGLGKSFFALQAAAAVASGGRFLGLITTQARVLLVMLELDRIALHERSRRMPPLPEGLDVVYSWPRGETALEYLEAAVAAGYLFIVVDMLGGILPLDVETNSYDLTPWLLRLRHIALDNGAAILALHHSIKGDSGDPVTNLMGSTAFGGQADSIISIERKRGESGAKIYVAGNHGRERVISARFDDCRWIPVDEEDGQEGPRLTDGDTAVVRVLQAHPVGLSASTIAGTLGKSAGAVRACLSRLAARGLVLKIANTWRYSPPTQAPIAPSLPYLDTKGPSE
jgi:hypothetical protein